MEDAHNALLKDLVVVELASVLAGPAVGMFFAELGATVIKVENKHTGGDITRKWKLPSEDPIDPFSAYYHSINYGKKSIFLDLTEKKDIEVVWEWVKKADIVISNFKSDSAWNLGIDYDSLRKINDRIIYGYISAYGEHDSSPGFDAMIQAETGWIDMTGEVDGKPVKLPVALVDVMAGHQLKQGILLALLKKEQTGKGSVVHVSLYDASIAALTNQASNWLNVGHLPRRLGTQHPNIAPYGDVFTTSDGVTIILGTGTQLQFENLCHCLNLVKLLDSDLYKDNTARLRNRTQLCEILAQAFKELTYTQLKVRSTEKKVTLAQVKNMEEVFENPAAQDLILERKLDDGSIVKSVRTAIFTIK